MRLALLLFLALAWLAWTGDAIQCVLGLLLGSLILWLIRPLRSLPLAECSLQVDLRARPVRPWRIPGLIAFFIWELLISVVRLTHDILTPTHHMRPAILAVPLDLKGDLPITLLAALVTLTPGTLSMEIAADRGTLFVHAMYVRDPAQAIAEIKQGFERRIKEIFEP